MVSSVVALSDVHGVPPVLDVVLAEPDVAAAEGVVVTGDHAAGRCPVEDLDWLTSLGDRSCWSAATLIASTLTSRAATSRPTESQTRQAPSFAQTRSTS